VIRGGVYRVDLGTPRGHEQGGHRFGVVLSPSESPLTVVTVVPTSTSVRPTVFRPAVTICGRDTHLLVDQMRAVDTRYVHDIADVLSFADLETLEIAVARYLGF